MARASAIRSASPVAIIGLGLVEIGDEADGDDRHLHGLL